MNTLQGILHMENQNGIKSSTMIFVEGLSIAKKKLLYVGANAESVQVSQFIADVLMPRKKKLSSHHGHFTNLLSGGLALLIF